MTALTADELKKLETEARTALAAVSSAAELEAWRVQYVGRKGAIPQALRQVKELPDDARRELGQRGNQLRQTLEAEYQQRHAELEPAQTVAAEPTAGSVAGTPQGHLHPLTIALRQVQEIFAAMGFLMVEGPDVEEARYNFDYLNIPFEHPARAETDTFYLKDLPDLVLRTHVSPLQIRGVTEQDLKPPFRILYYGPSYRSEKEDATHFSHFQQYEFMVVQERVTLADLKGIVQTFYSLFFGSDFEVRFRPAYYPFVEPGFDVDMRDTVTGRGEWLEMAGAGIVHPNVLRNINVDPEKFQGIALGGGLDRLVMLRHQIPDGRLFYGGDLRFLRQFS